MRKAELPSVEESEISIAPHDPDWARLYVEEADRVEATFGGRCVAIEHIGSTAVPGLLAKPIVDILVASVDGAAPSVDELEALAAQSYVFPRRGWAAARPLVLAKAWTRVLQLEPRAADE